MKQIEKLMVRAEKSLDGLLGTYQKEIKDLYEQLHKAKDQIESLQFELDDKNEELALLHAQLEEKEDHLEQMEIDLTNVHPDYSIVQRVMSLPSKEAFLLWQSAVPSLTIKLTYEKHKEILDKVASWQSSSFVTLYTLYSKKPKMRLELVQYYWEMVSSSSTADLQRLLLFATIEEDIDELPLDDLANRAKRVFEPSLRAIFLRWLNGELTNPELDDLFERHKDLLEQLAIGKKGTDLGLKLKEKSILREMGYQIQGTTRAKRWTILQRAVKVYGLARVTNVIESNIKLRSTTPQQRKRYFYSINEWNYDLNRLFETY
ncbi:hypothetical protein V7075_27770 [Neobacillus drentensis]|uniref:coiled-coil domain-containing protein n=1 Tax=Neobacillus drentensis TaxID=220684 RepID=UPI0030004357